MKDQLGFDIIFDDLYSLEGLCKIDKIFCDFLLEKNEDLFKRYQLCCDDRSGKVDSELLIEVAKILEEFLAELFVIKKENDVLKLAHDNLQKIYVARREFVQRHVAKKFNSCAADIDGSKILRDLEIAYKNVDELEIILAQQMLELLWEVDLSEAQKLCLKSLEQYAVWALYSNAGKKSHQFGSLFILPKKVDHQRLFEFEEKQENGGLKACYLQVTSDRNNHKDNFNLTDSGFGLNRALLETHYCIFCHKQNKDSCRTGMIDKKMDAATQRHDMAKDLRIAKDPLEVELHGCPLEQKISEMNLLKSQGLSIAALAVVVIDNPMVAGTGHRICNDCMKACIYQKQDAVDIPQVETKALKDVLSLPYGFEIYSLLTRWNPLNLENPLPKLLSGKKVLIAGLGPAGYTLAHYLLNDGHIVVAIDGLKIEPLDAEISGVDAGGKFTKFKPIKFVEEIYEPLQSRVIGGFGGVAEYGITSRWDKNFLKIIRLLLERRQNFRMFGGLRFGSSITDLQAFNEYGFDHVALCIGAGKPNIIEFKGNFAKGVRMASDFLMALHMGGAYKKELLTNLQIRMPIIVIGGGLTATDVACEAQAYYLQQIEIFANRYNALSKIRGEKNILAQLNAEEKLIVQEFLQHYQELDFVRSQGGDVNELLKKWGGSKIIYRKKIQEAPSYKLNHIELAKAFEQGVEMIENVNPSEAIIDEFNAIKALEIVDNLGKKQILDCRSLLVAAGTSPNLSPATVDNLDLKTDGRYFVEIAKDDKLITASNTAKPEHFSVITKVDPLTKKAVSFFGDLHPNFEGNVVKAMASAKRGYKQISEVLVGMDAALQRYDTGEGVSLLLERDESLSPHRRTRSISNIFQQYESLAECEVREFLQSINQQFLVKIEKVERLSDHVIEVFVKAPLLAKRTKIGQIFRLQNYQKFAQKKDEKILQMEGVTVTALEIDQNNGVISGIVVETGGSTSLIRNFKDGEPCIFMGPSGEPTEIPKNKTVLLIGGGRGNQPLITIAKACKDNGCHVLFFAGYRKNEYVVRQEMMQKNSDVLICAIEEELPQLQMPQEQQFQGTVTDALKYYFSKNPQKIAKKIDYVFAIGNDNMMHEVARLRHENLVKELAEAPIAITSLNAPMQCMMKGVCSQCLQKRVDKNGEVEYFYSCANQDQNTDRLDFEHLHNRCQQNSLLEKITSMLGKI